MLPENYDRVELERELQELRSKIEDMKVLLTFTPQRNPVADPKIGMIMYSDGEVSSFNGHAGRGLYRYDYLNKDIDDDLGWIRIASSDVEPYVITGDTGDSFNFDYLSDFVLVRHSRDITGSWTIVLPDPSVQKYRTVRFVSDDSVDANHKVLLDPGTNTIDGSTSDYEINRNFEGITIFSDGLNWIIIQAKDK